MVNLNRIVVCEGRKLLTPCEPPIPGAQAKNRNMGICSPGHLDIHAGCSLRQLIWRCSELLIQPKSIPHDRFFHATPRLGFFARSASLRPFQAFYRFFSSSIPPCPCQVSHWSSISRRRLCCCNVRVILHSFRDAVDCFSAFEP